MGQVADGNRAHKKVSAGEVIARAVRSGRSADELLAELTLSSVQEIARLDAEG